MVSVKVSTNFTHWPLARQTPKGEGVWGGIHFFVNQPLEDCDFWVVLDGLSRTESARCNPSNTLLVTCEPSDVKRYASDFLGQFGAVLTSQEDIVHPRVLLGQQGLPWMIGAELDAASLTWTNFMSFEEIEAYETEKHRLLSIVASRDSLTAGHARRNRFIQELKATLGDRIDVYGLGYRPIADKLDAIGPYRYHIAVENSCARDYWTEKLADAYLGRAFPIYGGCPNIGDYFPAGSYEPLNIEEPVVAARRVMDIIRSDMDKTRLREVEEARRRVLYEHNVFAVLSRAISDLRQTSDTHAAQMTLHPEAAFPKNAPAKRSSARELVSRYIQRWRT